jgi:hypothetical protein
MSSFATTAELQPRPANQEMKLTATAPPQLISTSLGSFLMLAHGFVGAETGFLDRSLTVGTVTYRYQVYLCPPSTRGKVVAGDRQS